MIRETANRALSLRSGDFTRGGPFFLYYFLIIASYTMGQVAGDALFMDRFKAVQLPYADIARVLGSSEDAARQAASSGIRRLRRRRITL